MSRSSGHIAFVMLVMTVLAVFSGDREDFQKEIGPQADRDPQPVSMEEKNGLIFVSINTEPLPTPESVVSKSFILESGWDKEDLKRLLMKATVEAYRDLEEPLCMLAVNIDFLMHGMIVEFGGWKEHFTDHDSDSLSEAYDSVLAPLVLANEELKTKLGEDEFNSLEFILFRFDAEKGSMLIYSRSRSEWLKDENPWAIFI